MEKSRKISQFLRGRTLSFPARILGLVVTRSSSLLPTCRRLEMLDSRFLTVKPAHLVTTVSRGRVLCRPVLD